MTKTFEEKMMNEEELENVSGGTVSELEDLTKQKRLLAIRHCNFQAKQILTFPAQTDWWQMRLKVFSKIS